MDYSELYDPTKTLQDYLDIIKNNIQEVDPNIDTTEGTPMANILTILANTLEYIMEMSLAVYNDLSPYTASLQALINVYGALYGVE